MNPYFQLPHSYRRIHDKPLAQEIAELIRVAETEEAAARRRLADRPWVEPFDRRWFIDDFAAADACYHQALFAYVEMLLEREAIRRLDRTTFLQAWAELREGRCAYSPSKRSDWLERHYIEVRSDWFAYDSHRFGGSLFPKLSVTVETLYEVAPALRCVRYYRKARGDYDHVYALDEDGKLLLYRVFDGFGRLASERWPKAFIFIQ